MPEMKKLVLKVDVNDAKDKQKAMKIVSGLSGIDSLSMDLNERKLTVIGDVDPVNIVSKLRKNWHTDILTVGPAKEPEKKDGDQKKDDGKKKEDEKKEDKKPKTDAEIYEELLNAYRVHNANYMAHHHQPHYVVHHGVEENPNGCVIC